jgi:hypothetical protein
MALPRLPRNIPLRDGVRAVTSKRRALAQRAMYSPFSTRSAASSGRFPPAARRSVPPHALIPQSRRSALRAKVPASARAFAAVPAPLQSTGSVYGFAGSAAPTVSVSCCGCVPAIARPSPPAALLPAPPPLRFVSSFESFSATIARDVVPQFFSRVTGLPAVAGHESRVTVLMLPSAPH